MTSPPCQLGKPRPSDARMCCIALPRQLTSYDAEAGGCGVMPHESHASSDLSVMVTKSRDVLVRAELPGLDSVTAAQVGAEEEERHRHGQQHRAHPQRDPRDWRSAA